MKTSIKILIWIVSVALSCSMGWSSFFRGGAGYREVPYADIRVLLPIGWTLDQTYSRAEEAILALKYVEQPPQMRGVQGQESRWFTKQDFEISYTPATSQFRPSAIWLDFHEYSGAIFTVAGMAEYDCILAALASVGLYPPADDDPRYSGRTVQTPAMFNETHLEPQRTTQTELLYGISLLSTYGLLFFLPGFLVAMKLFKGLNIPTGIKRILFIVGTSIVLAPAPLPLLMFGPIFLLPMPLVLPFVLGSEDYAALLAMSIGGTMILASIISLRVRVLGTTNSEVNSVA